MSQPDGLHYLGMRDAIAARIAGGELKPGERLPSERQLQIGGGVARGTIREALFQLEAEGLIYRKDRSGWYVSPPPVVYDPTRWEGFMSYVEAQGRHPTTETLSKTEIACTPALSAVFGRPVGAPLYRIRRRRSVDGRAVLVETIVVDAALAPDLLGHPLDGSLTSVLKSAYNIAVARNRVDMQPCALTRGEAEALQVKSGLPGLNVVRTSYDAQGRVVEFDREYWRHDALKISVDIRVR
ncbi:MAG: UTRA domain-containing protein [Candidatus Brevundimonas colombiensis]|uniref:UTRA domain-containing protein n=1 Tax=Candidatus Brevundimonas colombiensis TaxID=3121376 RepID=A0AAJ5X0A0_9CAUL|nr:UTRA domain-containing protein [Brevundimonas sp.]WEK40075.1 MAG: UTRA domain-containing protein [Brevundimonas sp.]